MILFIYKWASSIGARGEVAWGMIERLPASASGLRHHQHLILFDSRKQPFAISASLYFILSESPHDDIKWRRSPCSALAGSAYKKAILSLCHRKSSIHTSKICFSYQSMSCRKFISWYKETSLRYISLIAALPPSMSISYCLWSELPNNRNRRSTVS